MFCFQCQETMKNQGCTKIGMCGKKGDTAELQDLLIHLLKGIAVYRQAVADSDADRFVMKMLFTTITNVNFDIERLIHYINDTIKVRDAVKAKANIDTTGLPDCALWVPSRESDYATKAQTVGIFSTDNEDVRSLQQFLIIGLKGVAAYAEHAEILGFENQEFYDFMMEALVSTTKNLSVDEMIAMVLRCGEFSVKIMALLDEANTTTYGHPEITEVNIGVRKNPGILISGHDLKDLHELLEQTKGTGVDVYTHGEMLPAHYYPAFKNYENFAGNYGSSWFHQNSEFASFNGPILMTTNCIIPVKESYKDRIFTTSIVAFPGVAHIQDRTVGKAKDFSAIIELAKKCPPPTEIETGKIIGGFGHNQVLALADKVVAAIKSGAIKRFFVMAGCDGRHKSRDYFTEVAQNLPADTIILTAGCAKYRYNKLNLGDIAGIPRVLDAGQCNDSYSLAVIALKLKDLFGVQSINDLPISFDIAWYEQKAVAVLLALLHLGIKGIRIGPTLPGFLSPAVAKVLIETFDLKLITTPQEDVNAMMAGN